MDYPVFDPFRYSPTRAQAARSGAKTLRSIQKWVGKDKSARILEIGCGSGSLLFGLKNAGYSNCIGVDRDANLIEYGINVLGVNAAVGEWLSFLEGRGDKFDVIIALDVLEHVPREAVVDTLNVSLRRLRPGGRLLLRVPNALCPFAAAIICSDLTHRCGFTPRSLGHALTLAGFTGPIIIEETRPSSTAKRFLFAFAHALVVKPLVGLLHYHFHGEFPSHITPNVLVISQKPSDEKV
jgi:2-polyprenyl-3-methyl-5-hydroxy-6-metoxy-1,4-benzoquinol methylase